MWRHAAYILKVRCSGLITMEVGLQEFLCVSYCRSPKQKAHTCSQKPSHSARSFAGKEKRPGEGHSRSQDGSQGNNYGIVQQSTGDQQGSEKKDQDSQNPTDVDVAVRPVDTTIAGKKKNS